jgi:hypothetical protein
MAMVQTPVGHSTMGVLVMQVVVKEVAVLVITTTWMRRARRCFIKKQRQ